MKSVTLVKARFQKVKFDNCDTVGQTSCYESRLYSGRTDIVMKLTTIAL